MLLFCTLSENRPGANRVTGKLAVKVAKLLGAGRVVAAGRNQEALSTLHLLGADAIISPRCISERTRRGFCS